MRSLVVTSRFRPRLCNLRGRGLPVGVVLVARLERSLVEHSLLFFSLSFGRANRLWNCGDRVETVSCRTFFCFLSGRLANENCGNRADRSLVGYSLSLSLSFPFPIPWRAFDGAFLSTKIRCYRRSLPFFTNTLVRNRSSDGHYYLDLLYGSMS